MPDAENSPFEDSSDGGRRTPPNLDPSFRLPSDSDQETQPDPVEALVAECLARVFVEGDSAIDDICSEHPEHAEEIRASLKALQGIGFAETPSHEAAFPERLGDFRLLRRLGGGGMGVVYLAEQESLQRQVALKLIRPDQLYFPQARLRFSREIEAIARAQHPGIVPIYAVGSERGLPYFAMEWVPGATLAELIADLGDRDPASLSGRDLASILATRVGRPEARVDELFSGGWTETCLRIVRRVAEALEHVHARGILHRDVKPSNVMLTLEGRVLLLDFGLASHAEAARITQTGSQPGSLAYMSPEQIEGSMDRLDARTDVYALGVTLYELLALDLPFRAKTAQALRQRIVSGHPSSLRETNARVSWEAETVCLTAMDPDPSRRYPSAIAMAEDLERVLQHRPIAARRPSASLRARRWVQRHPTLSVGGTVLAAAIAIGTSGFAWQQHAARLDLDDANTQLKDALADAEAQSARAQRHYGRTRAAIEELLYEVGHLGLRNEPQSEEIRRRVLERALAHYRDLLTEDEARDDPHLRIDLARTQLAIAGLLTQLRRDEEALAACRATRSHLAELPQSAELTAEGERAACEELQIRTAILSEMRRDREAREAAEALVRRVESVGEQSRWETFAVDRAISWETHGSLLSNQGELSRAQESLRRAWEILTPLHAEGLLDDRGRKVLADTHDQLGFTASESGDLVEAEKSRRRALGLREQICADRPDWYEARIDLATTATGLAGALEDQDRYVEARVQFDRAIELLDDIVTAFPASPHYRRQLAAAINNRARMSEWAGDGESVIADYERVSGLMSTLIEERPEVEGFVEDRATARQNIGRISRDASDLARAERELSAALDDVARLVERNPEHADYRRLRAAILDDLGLTYEAGGDPERAEPVYREALSLAEGLVDQAPDDGDSYQLLVQAQYRLAWLDYTRGRWRSAREALAQPLTYWREATEAEPTNPSFRFIAAQHEWLLIELLLADGEADAARREAEHLGNNYRDRSGEQLMTADFLVRAAALGEGREREAALEQAMVWLHRSVEVGGVAREMLESDRRFEALQGREDWPALLEAADRMAGDWTDYETAWTAVSAPGQDQDAYERARDRLQGLLRDHPVQATFRVAAAVAAWRLGETEKAHDVLDAIDVPASSDPALRREVLRWILRLEAGKAEADAARRFARMSRSREVVKKDAGVARLLDEIEALVEG